VTLFSIKNGDEKIPLDIKTSTNDTIQLSFKEMSSHLKIVYTDSNHFLGYWTNERKDLQYPISGSKGNYKRFESFADTGSAEILNSYEITFGSPKDNWPAVGLFKQNGDVLTGTFLTETGDYRYLEGNVFGDQVYLSCFDGAHAFVFTAKIFGDSLLGKFYSGASYQTDWTGISNADASIGDPNKLTYLTENSYDLSEIKFKALFLGNKKIKFKNNPLTVIQIMGSWCPNCLDETNYFKVLHQKYANNGLQIIALGFESQKTRIKQKKHLRRFKKKAVIPYSMYLAGNASKKEASKIFSMLNGISSFPTTLFVNQKGDIIHVHTGFYGPGTGIYYERYKKETEGLIKKNLSKKN
jgi:thiol-disulfide isomerase/thioredoxin